MKHERKKQTNQTQNALCEDYYMSGDINIQGYLDTESLTQKLHLK